MTVNELNSKIHLPSLAIHLGMRGDYSFVKIPKFGWFGYNKDKSYVFDCVALFEDPDISKIYRYLTKDKPEFQEHKMFYSEVLENKLVGDYTRNLCAKKLLHEARLNTETGQVKVGNASMSFMHAVNEFGMSGLLYLGVGLLTPRLLKGKVAAKLGLREDQANKLLIPTYATPGHFCSLESVSLNSIDKPDALTQLYVNQERGWYGELNKTVVGELRELLIIRGCTWDPKIDHWTSETVDLSTRLSVQDCIQIWSKCRNLVCLKSPLEVVKANGSIKLVKNYLKDLTLGQVIQLEQFSGEKLQNYWIASRSVEAEVCGEKFSCHNDRYYLYKHGSEVEYSNFAIKLTSIIREDDNFHQLGFIHFNGTETPFKVPRRMFDTQAALMHGLNRLFLETGLGIPSIAPNYKHYIPAVVNAFNPDNPIQSPTRPAGS